MPSQPLTPAEVQTCIAAVLGRKPDQDLVDYHVRMRFSDAIAFGGYLRSTGEFRSSVMHADGGRKTISTFLGDRVLAYTHMGEGSSSCPVTWTSPPRSWSTAAGSPMSRRPSHAS